MAGGRGQKRGQGSAGGAASDPGRGSPPQIDLEWVPSTCTEAVLEELVRNGVLPERARGGWRPTAGESFPTPANGNELVVFADYFRRGFGLPAHPFLRKLLGYYQIRLIHLHPNSILHLSVFIHLCEAFLGILPHFNLFRHLFYLRAFTGSGSPKVVGGLYLCLRDGMRNQYLGLPLNTSMKGWNSQWFVTSNPEPQISNEVNEWWCANGNWTERPTSAEMGQVEELLGIIRIMNLTGVAVAINFVLRRV